MEKLENLYASISQLCEKPGAAGYTREILAVVIKP